MCIVSVHCLESGLLEVLGPPRLLAGGSFFGSAFTLSFNASAAVGTKHFFVGTKHVSVMQATLSNEHEQKKKEKDF